MRRAERRDHRVHVGPHGLRYGVGSARRHAARAGAIRSTSDKMWPSGSRSCASAATVAATAPHCSCPSTTTRCTPRCSIAYSMLPSVGAPATWPASRTTKRSPRPSSKTISGGTRESEQLRTTAKGCCSPSTWCIRTAPWSGCSRCPSRKRALPARRRANASSADTSAGRRAGAAARAARVGSRTATQPMTETASSAVTIDRVTAQPAKFSIVTPASRCSRRIASNGRWSITSNWLASSGKRAPSSV
jgi:hypothetical protein